jgi:cytochrome c oxidase assembly protein subunit 15
MGIVADAALGAIVVATKLNPWLVSLHLLLSLVLVVVGAVFYHRSKYLYGPGTEAAVRDPRFQRLARLLRLPSSPTLVAGTFTTGSGPHSAGSQGQLLAKRLPIAFFKAAWVHSAIALSFLGLLLGLWLLAWTATLGPAAMFGLKRLSLIASIQALIGVLQYVTHVPALLVELHVVGAMSLTIGVTQFHLKQTTRAREPGTRRT